MLQAQEKFSELLLLEWHKSVFAETEPDIAGKYRDYGVRVGSHIAPDWRKVPELMRKLVSFGN